jgi:hypothetical protein
MIIMVMQSSNITLVILKSPKVWCPPRNSITLVRPLTIHALDTGNAELCVVYCSIGLWKSTLHFLGHPGSVEG